MAATLTADWPALAFAAGPADRARAEAGVRAAYEAAGLAPPAHIVWAHSPAQGAVAAAALAGAGSLPESFAELPGADLLGSLEAGASVRDAVRTRPWEAARAEAHARLGPQEWARAWARTGAPLWNRVNDLVQRVRRSIGELGGERAEGALRGATLDAVLGQHDAPWLALFDAVGVEAGRAGLDALAEVAGSAGWWWPYERVAIISERPVELHLDEPGRLHRGDGPALAYPDGFALHAWRGMPVPAGFTETLAGLTVEQIDAEDNAELRRVKLEYFGYDRYLAETGAKPLHRDETGVLWRIDLAADEPVVMVEVVNSTPEPDGTYRTYYLRVPPGTRTAREGVAWTFGVDAADYRPEKET